SMGCPAGMTDAVTTGCGPPFQLADQIIDTAGPLAQMDLGTGQGCQARTIVAAVFEPPKPFNQNRLRFLTPDVCDDSAHEVRFPVFRIGRHLYAFTIRPRALAATGAVALRVSTTSAVCFTIHS